LAVGETVRRYLVFGKVQGVYFRHSTRLEAERLGLRGLTRNLADGSVEVIAQGAPAALETLRIWLQHGPPQARVARVEESNLDAAAVLDAARFQVL
jgi:acylphosphatase